MSNSYKEDSIQKLDPLSFTRLRSDTYLGSNETSTQLVREIVTNCYDEFLAGNCSEIWIEYKEKDNIVIVRDSGQGIIPNVKKEDGRTILEMVYGDINTSAKYDKSDTAVYKTSTGAFGIGASLTNFLSHWLVATTKRDGEFETVHFKEGVFSKRESGKCGKDEHGVEVRFNPSEEFFRDAKPDLKAMRQEFFNMSCVCAGLKIHFEDKEYYHPDGLVDLLEEKTKNDIVILNNPFNFKEEQGRQYLDFIMTATSSSKSSFDCFCNYSIVEAGTPLTAVKSCITRVFNKWAKENNLIKNSNLSGSDIQEGMTVIFNLASPNIRYDSQTKVRVTSTEDNSFISDSLGKELEVWLDNNPEDATKIIEKALIAKRAAEAAKKAREAVKNKQNKKKRAKIMNPDKLKDAEHLGQDSTLLVVEGLSAGSTVAVARDIEKYGILMLRGKLINSFTNDDKKLYNNEEIQLLLKALNITEEGYDSSQLRYGKVAICTDSDSDGYHIGLLVMTALQHFCPEFIAENRLCWLRSPLYIAKYKDHEDYYFTDQDLDRARSSLGKCELQRNKGLGSLTAQQARNSMFGVNQRLEVLEPSYNAILLLEELMGSSVDSRRNFIFNKIDFSEVRE